MTVARTAAVAAACILLAFPATGSAAQTLFGSDLTRNPGTNVGNNVSQFNGKVRAGSAVATAAAPVTGVLVKIKVKHDGGGIFKPRIYTDHSTVMAPNHFRARSARPDGSTTLGITLPSGADVVHDFNPTDAQGDPVGVPINAGEYVGGQLASGMSAVSWDGNNSSTSPSNGTYIYLADIDPTEAAMGFNTNPDNGEVTIQGVIEPDSDGDNYGDDTQDACDADATAHEAPCPTVDQDSDGTPNNSDNCPAVPNPGQENADGDPVGDACDSDDDGDGVLDDADNCDLNANPGQENLDGDAGGDVCDTDDDGDGAADAADNCPVIANASQTNTDGDAQGDSCDGDDDNDTVVDGSDNCDRVANADQKNTDSASDGGDACDADDDNDGVPDSSDSAPLDPNVKTPVAQFNRIAAAFVQSTRATRTATRFRRLDVTGVPAGAQVLVTCRNAKRKRACPFRSRKVTASGATVRLVGLFKKRSLPVGTVVTVRVSAAGSIAPAVTYTIRAGKAPRRVVKCLDPTGKTVSC